MLVSVGALAKTSDGQMAPEAKMTDGQTSYLGKARRKEGAGTKRTTDSRYSNKEKPETNRTTDRQLEAFCPVPVKKIVALVSWVSGALVVASW